MRDGITSRSWRRLSSLRKKAGVAEIVSRIVDDLKDDRNISQDGGGGDHEGRCIVRRFGHR